MFSVVIGVVVACLNSYESARVLLAFGMFTPQMPTSLFTPLPIHTCTVTT